MARRRRSKSPWWAELSLEELLDVRLCDLELRVEGTALEARIERLYEELRRAGLRFRPYVWLSNAWFTPEGSTGFAIPFFLAHPRLVRLEHAQMFEAEGSSHGWCMKLLRHETGHAIDNAYRLHRRKIWRETFGSYRQPYRDLYLPKPNSKDYVQNLGFWYAQSHPAEDYAESFAVWLTPRSRWRRVYDGWPARTKLECVDELMQDIAGRPAAVRTRDRPDSLPRQRTTLREHYQGKKAVTGESQAWVYDRYLRRLFADAGGTSRKDRAATFLRRSRPELRSKVSALTGRYRYIVDQALHTMIARCKEIDLRLTRSPQETRLGAAILLTTLTLNITRGRSPRFRR